MIRPEGRILGTDSPDGALLDHNDIENKPYL
jgi:hypothetical protein